MLTGSLPCIVTVEVLGIAVQPDVVEQLDVQLVRVDCSVFEETQTLSVQLDTQTVAV